MNSATLMLLTLAGYAAAYKVYGTFLKRNFQIDPDRKTPAHTRQDGVDFVPAKNWWVLFGHHFSSICGAGPIVGPAMAVAYWGWGVSAVWIVCGAIFMGAVSDFSALVLSMRERGESIANIAGGLISKRACLLFSVFLWISLILVIAVFSIFAAQTFVQAPDAVLPSFGLIPVAVLTGWLMYRTNFPNSMATAAGLALLAGLLVLGKLLPLQMPGAGGLSSQNLWILLLLIYCFAASVAPVQVLLQPRDYLASFILFGMIALGVAGIFVARPDMSAPAFTGFLPEAWPQAGPLWPMLFVTIACGAISGFHTLVSSGTTCKQISTERHACRIGYGGMLVESLVGILVLIAVAAGISTAEHTAALKQGGPIAAFSLGYGSLTRSFLGDYGVSFAVLALNAFILTTLDTASRITRYLTSEVFGVRNMYLSTGIVVTASFLLAVTGQWQPLWPAFGASNQLIAGIALLVASLWLLSRSRSYWVTLIPAFFMLLTTLAAFGYQWIQAFSHRDAGGAPAPDWALVIITSVLILVALTIVIESLSALGRLKKQAGVAKI